MAMFSRVIEIVAAPAVHFPSLTLGLCVDFIISFAKTLHPSAREAPLRYASRAVLMGIDMLGFRVDFIISITNRRRVRSVVYVSRTVALDTLP